MTTPEQMEAWARATKQYTGWREEDGKLVLCATGYSDWDVLKVFRQYRLRGNPPVLRMLDSDGNWWDYDTA